MCRCAFSSFAFLPSFGSLDRRKRSTSRGVARRQLWKSRQEGDDFSVIRLESLTRTAYGQPAARQNDNLEIRFHRFKPNIETYSTIGFMRSEEAAISNQ